MNIERIERFFFAILGAAFFAGAISAQTKSEVHHRAGMSAALPEGVTTKDARFHSEGVECFARIFLPKGFSPDSKAAAVVLAPGWGETEPSVEKYAARIAGRGLVAMAMDYRGWGKSGGYVYVDENIRVDDRQRFSQHTARVLIRRKRLIPRDQVLDIRNAVSYIQGEPGVDRARVGIWGADMAGGHVVVVAATDVRIMAAVAQTPRIEGNDVPTTASKPPADFVRDEIQLARDGQAPSVPASAAALSAKETTVALAEYHPFWYAGQVPKNCAMLFVVAKNDPKVNNETNAIAASKEVKGATDVVEIPSATHVLEGKAADSAADAAADWFAKHL
ncbi:MAG TPA: acetylxylan esterase [Candidatus Acidoferrales bacterium]|nr:acetylxylan esterase [Candidatus Acidoferrales bacterium]